MRNNPRIQLLLVEDDPLQERLLVHMLSTGLPEHIEVSSMTDPIRALEHVQAHRVDLLVTDLDMPSVGGLELVRNAKQRNPAVQALVLTAASTSADLISALDLGATDYLLKPVRASLLCELMVQAEQRLRRWEIALAGTLERRRVGLTTKASSEFLRDDTDGDDGSNRDALSHSN